MFTEQWTIDLFVCHCSWNWYYRHRLEEAVDIFSKMKKRRHPLIARSYYVKLLWFLSVL